jgi:hypothetical protein
LSACEIEDFLCLYKGAFADLHTDRNEE